jgi:benzoate/toluate 1,2-dioxygenase alpha subunit
MSRGATRWVRGVSSHGDALGVDAIMSGTAVADEGLYVAIHDEWVSRMHTAIEREETERATTVPEMAK